MVNFSMKKFGTPIGAGRAARASSPGSSSWGRRRRCGTCSPWARRRRANPRPQVHPHSRTPCACAAWWPGAPPRSGARPRWSRRRRPPARGPRLPAWARVRSCPSSGGRRDRRARRGGGGLRAARKAGVGHGDHRDREGRELELLDRGAGRRVDGDGLLAAAGERQDHLALFRRGRENARAESGREHAGHDQAADQLPSHRPHRRSPPAAPWSVPRRAWLNLSRRLRLARTLSSVSARCNGEPSVVSMRSDRERQRALDIEGSIGGGQGELEPWKGFRARTCMWCHDPRPPSGSPGGSYPLITRIRPRDPCPLHAGMGRIRITSNPNVRVEVEIEPFAALSALSRSLPLPPAVTFRLKRSEGNFA